MKKYEASREGYDAIRWLGLSDKERQLEELCDKERYYSLEMNEEEEEMYKGNKLHLFLFKLENCNIQLSEYTTFNKLLFGFRGGREKKKNECYSIQL